MTREHLARSALDADVPALGGGQRPGDGQTQPGSPSATGRVGAVETFE